MLVNGQLRERVPRIAKWKRKRRKKERETEDSREFVTTVKKQGIQRGSVPHWRRTREKEKAKVGGAKGKESGKLTEKMRNGSGNSPKKRTERK